MEIQLRKWGNSIGFRIPQKLAENLGIDENSVVELTESKEGLLITKKRDVSTLDDLLATIPDDFAYPEDVKDFIEDTPSGREIL